MDLEFPVAFYSGSCAIADQLGLPDLPRLGVLVLYHRVYGMYFFW